MKNIAPDVGLLAEAAKIVFPLNATERKKAREVAEIAFRIRPPVPAGHSTHPPSPIPKTILFVKRAGHAYASRVLFGKTSTEGGTRHARRANATRLRLAMKAHGREALVRTVATLKAQGNIPSWYVNRRPK